MSSLLNINYKDFLSALAVTIVIGIGATIAYILGVGDIFGINLHSMLNVFVLSVLGGVGQLISSVFTTKAGNFAGAFPVK